MIPFSMHDFKSIMRFWNFISYKKKHLCEQLDIHTIIRALNYVYNLAYHYT